MTMKTVGQHTCEVSAEEVYGWLNSWDLTDSNAAKVLGVTTRTIKDWIKRGAKGAGGRHLRALICSNTSPYRLAAQLRVRLSTFRRSQFKCIRGSGVEDLGNRVDTSTPVEMKYPWPGRA